jgi:hypothetical protein
MLTNQENARIRSLENQIFTMGSKLNAMYARLYDIKNNHTRVANNARVNNTNARLNVNNARVNNTNARLNVNNARVNNTNARLNVNNNVRYTNNQQKGRFLVRRWQNNNPGYLMDPRI